MKSPLIVPYHYLCGECGGPMMFTTYSKESTGERELACRRCDVAWMVKPGPDRTAVLVRECDVIIDIATEQDAENNPRGQNE